MHKAQLSAGVDRLAPYYGAIVRLTFGTTLWKAQTYFLSELHGSRAVLIIGGGSGKILAELIDRGIGESYIYVDLSSKMIALTKDRPQVQETASLIKFIHGSHVNIPKGGFDAIIAPYVLDCFNDLELPDGVKAITRHLNDKGVLLFTDFHQPGAGIMRPVGKAVIAALYLLFRIAWGLRSGKLPNFDQAFHEVGLRIKTERYFLRQLVVTRVYAW